jgi:hypothetical protein
MRLSYILLLFVIFVGIHFSSCTTKTNDTACVDFPSEVPDSLHSVYLISLYNLYKHNLVEGDEYTVSDPFYMDSLRPERVLSEFELKYDSHFFTKDTLTFTFYFEKGVVPVSHPYYSSASFWNDDENIGINLDERYGIIYPMNYKKIEFIEYLKSVGSYDLACSLKEISERFHSSN